MNTTHTVEPVLTHRPDSRRYISLVCTAALVVAALTACSGKKAGRGPLSIRTGFTNSYLLPCTGGYLLIDTSYEQKYDEFMKKLRGRGVSPSEIKYILLTHHHDDHSGFAGRLAKVSGAAIITHRLSLRNLASGRPDMVEKPLNRCTLTLITVFNFFKPKKDWSFPPLVIGKGDRIVEGDDRSLLPSIGIDGMILHTPGHTRDSISVLLSDGSAFVGDAAMDLLNICGCRRRPIYITDLKEVYESWKKLLKYGARTVYSAHGDPFDAGEMIETMQRDGANG